MKKLALSKVGRESKGQMNVTHILGTEPREQKGQRKSEGNKIDYCITGYKCKRPVVQRELIGVAFLNYLLLYLSIHVSSSFMLDVTTIDIFLPVRGRSIRTHYVSLRGLLYQINFIQPP